MALPTPAAKSLPRSESAEFANRPADLPFLRGGIWRNFFSKYCESNLLHKKMQPCFGEGPPSGSKPPARTSRFLAARDQAKTLVLRGQCNDAYWHGIFGGLYSPHLRTALWRSLVQAEAIADSLTHRGRQYRRSNH